MALDPSTALMFEPSFLGKVNRKSDILSRLSELLEAMKLAPQLEAKERPKGFTKTAAQLMSNRIMGNNDKDMRLLSCCCILEMFRISAPDIPYSDSECIEIFETLVNQLRGLATCDPMSGSGMRIMYILHSLATVNTCVLPVLLAGQGVSGAEEVVTGMFHALISSIHADHDEEVGKLMMSVMVSILEESQEISQELLDVLLQPLLPSFKAENPIAYTIVGKVLQKSPPVLHASVSVFLNQVLIGAPSGVHGRFTESELTDHIYPLIYEIHRLAPNMLLKVLPNVCTQLQSEEHDVRLKAVKLLGNLFASTFAEYGSEFNRNFREFVGRFVDVSKDVRLEVVDCAALIIKRKPSLRELVEKPLRERLRDVDAEVRQVALQRLVEIALDDPLKLSVATFIEMGARVKDKRLEIRRGSLVGMTKIYSKHIASVLPPLNNLTESGNDLFASVQSSIVERLSHVPSLLINSWSYPDDSTKHQILVLLQEYLLPRTATAKSEVNVPLVGADPSKSSQSNNSTESPQEVDGCRASALYFMFAYLSDTEIGLLNSIMLHKASIRKELLVFLAARAAAPTKQTNTTHTAALKRSMMRLTLALPVADKDKKTSIVERLPSMKDRNIYKLLARAAQPLDATSEVFKGRDDVRSRVDSKSALGEFVGRLCDTAGYLIANEDIIDTLVNHASSLKPDSENASTVASLLALMAKVAPKAFSVSADGMRDWLNTQLGKRGTVSTTIANQPGSQAFFSVLMRGAEGLAEDDHCLELCHSLLKIAMENPDVIVCSQAAEAAGALALYSDAKDFTSDNSHSEKGSATGRLSGASVNTLSAAVQNSIRILASSKRLVENSSRLSCDLRAISSLLICPVIAQNDISLKSAFCRRIKACISSRRAIDAFLVENILHSQAAITTEDGHTIAACLHTWTTILCSNLEVEEVLNLEDSQSDQSSVDENINKQSSLAGGPPAMQNLADCLWKCMNSSGAIVGDRKVASSAATRNIIFEAAVSAALEVMRQPSTGNHISVPAWKELGFAMLKKDNIDVHNRLAKKLLSIVQTSAVHLKFLVYPALLALDENVGYVAAQSLLFNVKRLRHSHEMLSQRALTEESDVMQRKAAVNMPENVLPYVLYFLSYHPDFPSDIACESEDDNRKLKKMVGLVRSVVKVLIDSLGAEENNIAFLLKQVNMIQQHYEDRHDHENIGLSFVTLLASKILNDMVRTDENVQEYRGDVSLPMELYELRSDNLRPGQRPVIGDGFFRIVLAEGMQEAVVAIDRVLHAGKKVGNVSKLQTGSRKRTSVAARRPSKVVSAPGEQSGTDSDEDENKVSSTTKRSKPIARTSAIVVRDEGERKQPRRQSTIPVNYREHGESEKEADKWDELAGKIRSPIKHNKSLNGNVTGDSSDGDESVTHDMEISSPIQKHNHLSTKSDNISGISGRVSPEEDAPKKRKNRNTGRQTSMKSFINPGDGQENSDPAPMVVTKKGKAPLNASKKRRTAN
jgi:sister chromatid cohesion protein PDS5